MSRFRTRYNATIVPAPLPETTTCRTVSFVFSDIGLLKTNVRYSRGNQSWIGFAMNPRLETRSEFLCQCRCPPSEHGTYSRVGDDEKTFSGNSARDVLTIADEKIFFEHILSFILIHAAFRPVRPHRGTDVNSSFEHNARKNVLFLITPTAILL